MTDNQTLPATAPAAYPAQSKCATDRTARQSLVAHLYFRGCRTAEVLQAELARQGFQVHPDTVRSDLKTLRRTWRDESTEEFAAAVCRQLAELDLVRRVTWAQWDRSLTAEDKTKMTRSLTPEEAADLDKAGKVKPVLIETWKRGRLGDSR